MKVLEIGIGKGGSLEMWRDYFGTDAEIYGIDVRPFPRLGDEERIKTYTGDQKDPQFLKRICNEAGPFDIIIDDGGHQMSQQRTSFRILYPLMSKSGVYLCEDTHTSYNPDYEGGHLRQGTFIETVKSLVDELHAWRSRDRTNLDVTSFTKETVGIHIYDGMVFFEKGDHQKPKSLRVGQT